MSLRWRIHRWLHRRRLSRSRVRGTFLHRLLGDRLLHRGLWKPTRESLARGWLVGFPITIVPFLPVQSIFACFAAIFVRGNLLLCIALQFLSTPLTAPVHLPACFLAGEIVRGESPRQVWRDIAATPRELLSADAIISLYLGAAVIGVFGGAIGYAIIRGAWRDGPPPRRRQGTS